MERRASSRRICIAHGATLLSSFYTLSRRIVLCVCLKRRPAKYVTQGGPRCAECPPLHTCCVISRGFRVAARARFRIDTRVKIV